MWLNLLLQVGAFAIKEYAKNSDSTKDDKVLEIVKNGASYLAPKNNNDLDTKISDVIQLVEMSK